MKVELYTQTGEKKGQVDLPKEFFEVPYNADLIHQALIRQHGNARVAIAHVKNRSDVSGGGRKPFRQKGTGSARQGSTRAPNHKGGGVIFGPHSERNFKTAMPKKQRRKALFSALSVKAKNKEVMALEAYKGEEIKTKHFAEMVAKLPIKRNVLVVIPGKDEIIQRSSANLPNVKTILVNYLNIADLQKYRNVLFLQESIGKIAEVFGGAAPKTAKPKATTKSTTKSEE